MKTISIELCDSYETSTAKEKSDDLSHILLYLFIYFLSATSPWSESQCFLELIYGWNSHPEEAYGSQSYNQYTSYILQYSMRPLCPHTHCPWLKASADIVLRKL